MNTVGLNRAEQRQANETFGADCRSFLQNHGEYLRRVLREQGESTEVLRELNRLVFKA